MNRVNIKHVIGDLGDPGSVVTEKFNSRCYQAKVVDLLDWKPRKQRKEKSGSAAKKAKKPKRTRKRQNKPLFWGNGSPAKGQASSMSVINSSEDVKETPRRTLSEITNIQSSPMSSSPPRSPLQLSSLHHSFSNVSFVSRHIRGNLLLLALFLSEIIGPNLVRTTTHFRCIHMYLRMVGALMLTENFLDINLFSSSSFLQFCLHKSSHFGGDL